MLPICGGSTLPGVPIKRVLFQFARGDQTVPNPANSAWIRAAYMREWVLLYRHDLARAAGRTWLDEDQASMRHDVARTLVSAAPRLISALGLSEMHARAACTFSEPVRVCNYRRKNGRLHACDPNPGVLPSS